MAKRGNAPTKAEIAATVKALKAGKRIGVGNGIYVTKDASGRVRYQWRARMAGAGSRHGAGTHDTYDDAVRKRAEFLAHKETGAWRRRERGLKMRFTDFAMNVWWAELDIDLDTERDYQWVYELRVAPFWKGFTLGQILELDDFKPYVAWLEKESIKKHGVEKGKLATTSVQRALDLFLRILNHACREGYIDFNPYQRHHDKRRAQLKKQQKPEVQSQRLVLESEVPTLLTIERVRLAIRGRTRIERLRRRALISVLAYLGLRPGEALFLRWRHILTAHGPRNKLMVRGALKNLGDQLLEGGTKTRINRDAFLWPIVLEELLALYEAEGRPPLDALVFPNARGGHYWWGNFYRPWYKALFDAGISSAPIASAADAFVPYLMRHAAATMLFHAVKPSKDPNAPKARYAPKVIADHMGHTADVLWNVYTHVIDDDFHGATGRTVDELVRWARREIWGAVPGDADYVETRYTTVEASELTGISVCLLGNRIRQGTLVAERDGVRHLISGYELVSSGLLVPAQLRDQEAEAADAAAVLAPTASLAA